MQERQLDINGQLINYYSVSPGQPLSGTILFLHGWRSAGSVWLPLMRRLHSLGFASYALDLPGFGKSGEPRRAFTLDDYRDTVRTFIEKLGIDPYVLAGHSFGGRIAIKLAADNTVHLEKLVLVDSAGIREEPRMKTLKHITAKLLKPFFSAGFMQPLRRKLYALIGAEDYIATPRLRQTFLNIIGEDLSPFLPRIKAKTLIVWGERDLITPLASARTMAANIPRARLAIIPRAGHFSFLDRPDEFFDTLSAFLSKQTQ